MLMPRTLTLLAVVVVVVVGCSPCTCTCTVYRPSTRFLQDLEACVCVAFVALQPTLTLQLPCTCELHASLQTPVVGCYSITKVKCVQLWWPVMNCPRKSVASSLLLRQPSLQTFESRRCCKSQALPRGVANEVAKLPQMSLRLQVEWAQN